MHPQSDRRRGWAVYATLVGITYLALIGAAVVVDRVWGWIG